MFEADVLRLCLEAIAPYAAKRGVNWLSASRTGKKDNDLPCMFTVRTSRATKQCIDKLVAEQVYTEAETVRYCYDVILPIAYSDGFSRVMKMREDGL